MVNQTTGKIQLTMQEKLEIKEYLMLNDEMGNAELAKYFQEFFDKPVDRHAIRRIRNKDYDSIYFACQTEAQMANNPASGQKTSKSRPSVAQQQSNSQIYQPQVVITNKSSPKLTSQNEIIPEKGKQPEATRTTAAINGTNKRQLDQQKQDTEYMYLSNISVDQAVQITEALQQSADKFGSPEQQKTLKDIYSQAQQVLYQIKNTSKQQENITDHANNQSQNAINTESLMKKQKIDQNERNELAEYAQAKFEVDQNKESTQQPQQQQVQQTEFRGHDDLQQEEKAQDEENNQSMQVDQQENVDHQESKNVTIDEPIQQVSEPLSNGQQMNAYDAQGLQVQQSMDKTESLASKAFSLQPKATPSQKT